MEAERAGDYGGVPIRTVEGMRDDVLALTNGKQTVVVKVEPAFRWPEPPPPVPPRRPFDWQKDRWDW